MSAQRDSSWGSPDVVGKFETDGYTDQGEAAALHDVEEQSHGRVLDLGVGGGRTTGILASAAASYLGLDLSPDMIALARRRFGDADLRVGDAGHLDDLPTDGFDLVVWSFNGLDALGHADRLAALRGMARVTAPGGRVLFSSLNLDGVSYDERPWWLPHPTSRRARLQLAVLVRHPGLLVRSVRNYRSTRAASVDGDGWAMRPMRAHEFRFVVHFAALGEVVAEAAAAGLVVRSAWTETGAALDAAQTHTDADYVHFVCSHREPPAALDP